MHDLEREFPEYDLMICECNIWAYDPYTEKEQADYLEKFVNDLYNDKDSRLKAIIFYELLNEPDKQKGEKYFGLVDCSPEGVPLERKEAYFRMQNLLCGGEAVLEKA